MKFVFKTIAMTATVAASLFLTACGGGSSDTDTSTSSSAFSYKVNGVTHTEPVLAITVASGEKVVLETTTAFTGQSDQQISGNCTNSVLGNLSQAAYSFSHTGPCGRKINISTAQGKFQIDLNIEAPASSGGGSTGGGSTCPNGGANGYCWGTLISPIPVAVVGGVNYCKYTPTPAELAANKNLTYGLHPCP